MKSSVLTEGKSHHVYHYQLVERMERANQLNPNNVTVDQEGRGRGWWTSRGWTPEGFSGVALGHLSEPQRTGLQDLPNRFSVLFYQRPGQTTLIHQPSICPIPILSDSDPTECQKERLCHWNRRTKRWGGWEQSKPPWANGAATWPLSRKRMGH